MAKEQKQKVPELSGFVFNPELGLYIADGCFHNGFGLLGTSLNGSDKELQKGAHDKCHELYRYSPWESGYNVFAYLAAGELGLLSSGNEEISFTFSEALGLAKLLGVRIGTNREFTTYDRNYDRDYVPILLGDVYDFTQDDKDIDVYAGIATVLQEKKKYKFLDVHGEQIKPIRVRGAQARALRNADYGDVFRSDVGTVGYRDESTFLASGKRVTEFDEQGIPTKLDNEKYECTRSKGKYAHGHNHLSEFVGHRWIVDPKKGVVVMKKLGTDYWKLVGEFEDGEGRYKSVCCVSSTTYLTKQIDDRFWKTNIFAVTNLENVVEECLKALVVK